MTICVGEQALPELSIEVVGLRIQVVVNETPIRAELDRAVRCRRPQLSEHRLQRMPFHHFLRPVGPYDQHRQTLQSASQMPQECDRSRVGPLQIIDQQHQRVR